MPLDPNIILQGRGPQFADPMEMAYKAQNMRQMIMQNQAMQQQSDDKNQLNELYKKNSIVGPDGKTIINKQGVINDMRQKNPLKADELQQQFQGHDLAKMKFGAEAMQAGVGQATPENWAGIRQNLIQMGVPNADKLPEQVTPEVLNGIKIRSQEVGKQVDYAMREQEFNLKKQELADRRAERVDARAEKKTAKDLKDKELSITEAKQLGLFKTGQLAEQQYAEATKDKKKYDPTQVGQFIDNSEWAPNAIKNEKAIEAQGAMSSWVEAYLRDASGAAIPPSERMAYAKDFFPQPGDTETAIKNKAVLRAQKMENARIAAGPKAESQQTLVGEGKGPLKEPPPKNGATVGGYIFLGGDPNNQKSWKKL